MTLESYQTLFTVFLVITIILFILSIVFFFVFGIPQIFSIKTGRAVRKSMKELNEINRSEDNRRRKKYKGHSMQLSKELTGDFDKVTGEMTGNTAKTGNVEESSKVTAQLDKSGTVVLKNYEEPMPALDTEVLIQPKSAVEVVPMEMPVVEDSVGEKGMFNIIDKKMITFSSEIIQRRNYKN